MLLRGIGRPSTGAHSCVPCLVLPNRVVRRASAHCRKTARTRRLAIFIRESLLELGPTFIKVGQLFSTRSDLFPSEFTEVWRLPVSCICQETQPRFCLLLSTNVAVLRIPPLSRDPASALAAFVHKCRCIAPSAQDLPSMLGRTARMLIHFTRAWDTHRQRHIGIQSYARFTFYNKDGLRCTFYDARYNDNVL